VEKSIPKAQKAKLSHDQDSLRPIEERLMLEAHQRVSNGVVTVALTVCILWYTLRVPGQSTLFWPATGILMIVNAGIRTLYAHRFLKTSDQIIQNFRAIAMFSIINSILWGIGCFSIMYSLGPTAPESAIFVGIVFIFCTGISYNLAPVIPLVWAYLFFALTPIIVTNCILAHDLKSNFIGFFSLGFVHYCIRNSRRENASLRYKFELEEQIQNDRAKLSEEKEKLQNVVNSVPGFVAVADHQGEWIERSQSFAKFENLEELKVATENFLQSGLASLTVQIEWTQPVSGGRGKVEEEKSETYAISFEKMMEPQKGHIIVGVPIDELREAQRILESKLDQVSKQAATALVAGGLAHDVNNSLAILDGDVRILKKIGQDELSEKLGRHVQKLKDTVRAYLSLIKGSRQSAPEKVGINKMIETALEFAKPRLQIHGVSDLRNTIEKDIEINTQPVHIEMILANLLINAADALATAETKYIRLEAQPIYTEQGEFIEIQVVNPGRIPPETAARLFDSGFSTKGAGGSGVGLKISSQLAKANFGTLVFQQKENEVCFCLRLPMKQEKQESSDTTNKAAA